jgi:hypothetical protein
VRCFGKLRTWGKGGSTVEQSKFALIPALYEKLCLLAHDLNNGLGIIAGHCELMVEQMDPDSESARRLLEVRELAFSMAKKINGHECRMSGCNAPDLTYLLASEKSPTNAR